MTATPFASTSFSAPSSPIAVHLPTLPPPSHSSPSSISNRRPLPTPSSAPSSPSFRSDRHLVIFPSSPDPVDQLSLPPPSLSRPRIASEPGPRSPSHLNVSWGTRRNSCHSISEGDESEPGPGSILGLTTGLEVAAEGSRLGGVLGATSEDSPYMTLLVETERGRSTDAVESGEESLDQLRRPKRAWMLGERCLSTDSRETISSTSSLITPTSSISSSHQGSPKHSLHIQPKSQSESDLLSSSSIEVLDPQITSITLLPPVTDDGLYSSHTGPKKSKKEEKRASGFGMLKGWFGGGGSSIKMGKKDSKDKKGKLAAISTIPDAGSLLTPPSSAGATPSPSSTPSLSPNQRGSVRSFSHERLSPSRDGGESDTDEDEEDRRKAILAEKEAAEEEELLRASAPTEKKSKLFLSPIQTLSGWGRRSPTTSPGGSPILAATLDPLTVLPSIDGLPTSLTPPPNTSRPSSVSSSSSSLTSTLSSGLTPLQSLHLLSSQKLSLYVRPPPPGHPIFSASSASASKVSRLSGSYMSTDVGETTSSNAEKKERRFPGSTNRLTREGLSSKLGGAGGMRAEMGVRALMRRLEKGGKAKRDEVEALIDLFKRRPVSLSKNQTGNGFVAGVVSPSTESILLPPSPKSVSPASFSPGSGIIAFLSRPAFPERYAVWLPTSLKSFDGGIVTKKASVERACGEAAQLGFSKGMEAMGKEIRAGTVGSWRRSPRSSLAVGARGGVKAPVVQVAVPPRSPTDDGISRRLEGEPVIVEGLPKLPSVVLSPSTSTGSRKLPSSTSSLSLAPRPSPTPIKSALKPPSTSTSSRSLSAPSHPTPVFHPHAMRSQRTSPLSRQSYPAPLTIDTASSYPPASQLSSALSEDEDSEEDDLPLAELKVRKSSFLALKSTGMPLSPIVSSPTGSASSTASTVQARSIPPTPTAPASTASSTPSSPTTAAHPPIPTRSASKDRTLRWAPDTVDHSAALAAKRKEEAARRKEEEEAWEVREKERLRLEEEEAQRERRRQERLKEEVRRTRERREQAKLGEKKGNGGQWEEPNQRTEGSHGSRSNLTRRSESSRTLATVEAGGDGQQQMSSRPSTSRLVSTGGEGRKLDHRTSRTFNERPPSLVSNTANSSPQTVSPRSSDSSLNLQNPYHVHVKGSGSASSPDGETVSPGGVYSHPKNSYSSASAGSKHPSRSQSSSNIHSRASLYLPPLQPPQAPFSSHPSSHSPHHSPQPTLYSPSNYQQPYPSHHSPSGHHSRSHSGSYVASSPMWPNAYAQPQLAFPVMGYIPPPPSVPLGYPVGGPFVNPYFPSPPLPQPIPQQQYQLYPSYSQQAPAGPPSRHRASASFSSGAGAMGPPASTTAHKQQQPPHQQQSSQQASSHSRTRTTSATTMQQQNSPSMTRRSSHY